MMRMWRSKAAGWRACSVLAWALPETIRGPIGGGGGATVQILANNVTVAGFTITRLGNNTTDWNNPGLNSVGIAIQGLSITNTLIRDNIFVGNRTGIDINNSNGHTVRNNVIDFNRTGIIFRNQTDQMTVVENFVTNNWTVGILFLDASGGTNVPVQSALNSTFGNNNLSANWYGQIVDRQSGGALPAPGTTNLKKFSGNWFGTTSPVVTTANSAEPGYAAQIRASPSGAMLRISFLLKKLAKFYVCVLLRPGIGPRMKLRGLRRSPAETRPSRQ